MEEWRDSLKRFRLRVRLVRAWRGIALGGTFGALVCVAWAALDWLGWFYSEWTWLGATIAACAAAGAIVGLVLPVGSQALGDSIDRRAGLDNRIGTALGDSAGGSEFVEAQRLDALAQLHSLRPACLYPLKLDVRHAALVISCGLAALLFTLGNTPILLSKERREEREELQKSAQSVERVARPVLDDPSAAKPEERDVANDIERLAKEMRKGRIGKDAALQKANDLAHQADELSRKRYSETAKLLDQAETAKDKVAREELRRAGLEGANESQMKADPSDLDAERSRLEQSIKDLQSRIGNSGGRGGAQKAELQALLARAQRALQTLQLSERARKTLQKLFSMKEWQDLQKLAKKLSDAAQEGKNGNDTLTPEQIKKMQRELEDLAKKLKDDQAMRDYIEKLREAMNKAEGG